MNLNKIKKLEALQLLLNVYEYNWSTDNFDNDFAMGCPLCAICYKAYDYSFPTCRECPWYLTFSYEEYGNYICEKWYRKHFDKQDGGIGGEKERRNKEFLETRIAMIKIEMGRIICSK